MSGIAVSLGSLDKKTNITASTHTHLNLFLTLSHSLFPVFISRTYIRFTHTDNELCYCKACSFSPPPPNTTKATAVLICFAPPTRRRRPLLYLQYYYYCVSFATIIIYHRWRWVVGRKRRKSSISSSSSSSSIRAEIHQWYFVAADYDVFCSREEAVRSLPPLFPEGCQLSHDVLSIVYLSTNGGGSQRCALLPQRHRTATAPLTTTTTTATSDGH